MMSLQFNLFPGGRSKALTMSYDDGQKHDIRLTEIFDQYGIKGSFHLNSAMLNTPGFLTNDDVRSIGRNYEISAHSVTHPHLDRLPLPMVVAELLEDRRQLEKLVDYPIRGMSYPFGSYSQTIIPPLQAVGIEYSRTVSSTKQFDVPLDFMEWHPTCHHNDDINEIWEHFTTQRSSHKLSLCYIWGHSYEFEHQNNWGLMETFCQKAGGHADVWISIHDVPVHIKGGSTYTSKLN